MYDYYREHINHLALFVNDKNNINGIENFGNQANLVLIKYNRILKESFPLLFKECEFRFYCETPEQLLKILNE